ncbi:MAG TPA: protein kinase [Kofleriaceae bacterium]|nr:protein kinase [Kofleriaceae bacterium]
MVTPAQPSRRFLSQSDKLGKYEVIRQIAVGGMAELYLARTVGMEGFEKLVCVKRILPQYANNPSFVNMFLNEARLAAMLHHPNIAQVYDIGQDQGEFFFSMEYVHGEDLGRLVTTAQETGVQVTLDCALTLVSGLCAGLHYAHEKASPEGKPLGVVHRDVSPTNVLVSYDGAVKLVDFGIARAGGEPSQSAVGLKGKISYMSPEQCQGKMPVDRRSDVFSVGTILYELTTGRRPFIDETEYAVLQQIVNRDAEPPSAVVPGYPRALEAIVMRALARDVSRRFSTALDLQNQLEDFAHDNRLRVSPLVLARLMSTLFPARLEEWDHARAQGAFFVEQHVVRTLIESGKTPEGNSRYVPQPLPPPGDDGAAQDEVTMVPVGRGSAPGVADHAATQVGPPPVAQPGGYPRASTPPPTGSERISMPIAVATPVSQPRLPTPPPVPGQAPLPGVRYAMPVPNMPGAVPIVTPMMAPPIASAGTLVSSALQAGTGAATSTMPPPIATPPPGAFVPAPPADFGAGGMGYGSYGAPVGAADAGQFGAGHPGYAAAPATVRSAADARPTLMIRAKRRSRLPLFIVAVAGVVGAVAVVLVLNNGGDTTSHAAQPAGGSAPTTAPAAAEPAKPDETAAPTEPAKPAAAPVAEPAKPSAAAAPAGPGGATGRSASAGSKPAPPLAPSPDRATETAPAAPEPSAGDAPSALLAPPPGAAGSDPRKRTDVHKPARPKSRPDVKRPDPRRAKVDPKEPSWNDDSPFLPVQTQPKH